MGQQIPTDFWNPKKSKHYSQENGIDLDIYNYIIVYYSISYLYIYILYKKRYTAINASSLHVDSNQTPKRPKIYFHLQCFGISAWLPLDWSTQVASEIARAIEGEGPLKKRVP